MNEQPASAGEALLVDLQAAAPGLVRPLDAEHSTRFEAALEAPGNARAYHNRVLAKFNLGLSQDALPNYEQALLEQPDFADDYRDSLTFHLSRTKSGQ